MHVTLGLGVDRDKRFAVEIASAALVIADHLHVVGFEPEVKSDIRQRPHIDRAGDFKRIVIDSID